MNKGLAHELKLKIKTLSYLQKIGGLVYTQIKQERILVNGNPKTIIKKFPVTCDSDVDECVGGSLVEMIPSDKYKSMIYFEDNGMSIGSEANSYVSKLRLIGWFDSRTLDTCVGDVKCYEYSTFIISDIIKKLESFKTKNLGIYNKVIVSIDRVPAQDASIFSKYTYSENENQYLMPPYEYFAIDLSISFSVNQKCVLTIKQKDIEC